MEFPPPGVRLARIHEALDILIGPPRRDRGTARLRGRYHSVEGAATVPTAVQRPRPPVFVGGKGDRLLRMVVEAADGWNTCWVWTPAQYAGRREVLLRECDRVGRDPAIVWCSLGLYALCGEDEADLIDASSGSASARRRACSTGSRSISGGRAGWSAPSSRSGSRSGPGASLGVETLILGAGAVPFHLGAPTTSSCSPTPSARPAASAPAGRLAGTRSERTSAMNLGAPELLIILLVVVILFGGAKIPKLARSLGQAQKEFKSGLDEGAKSIPPPRRARRGRARRVLADRPRLLG